MNTVDTLRWVADAFRREAAGLPPTLDRFLAAINPDVWSGTAADRTRAALHNERAQLETIAEELYAHASRLDQRARQLEAQAAASPGS